ncbi:MAG: YkgJ family cysteine cluster protein [bacterium]
MNEERMDNFKREVLAGYPRLGAGDRFRFLCHRGASCFTQCCADVNIFLTPYDVIRMKNRAGISSSEFLRKHTVSPFTKTQKLPAVLLKMRDDERRTCPFVDGDGCTIYGDRPWPCRMYPLGVASPKEQPGAEEEFYFLIREPPCEGFETDREWTVAEWVRDQGADEYDRFGGMFKEIALHDFFLKGGTLLPEKMEMFYMVCYDVDRFRDFVFGSTFLKRFAVDDRTLETIKSDDLELLKFGFRWLRFSLFREDTFKIREEEIRRHREGTAGGRHV